MSFQVLSLATAPQEPAPPVIRFIEPQGVRTCAALQEAAQGGPRAANGQELSINKVSARFIILSADISSSLH